MPERPPTYQDQGYTLDPAHPIEDDAPRGTAIASDSDAAKVAELAADHAEAVKATAEREQQEREQAERERAEPESDEGDVSDVPDGTVSDVLAWVGDDPARAREALEAERNRAQPRQTLISELESRT